MYKSVKISEEAYLEANKLKDLLKNRDANIGRVGISNAIEYALHLALDNEGRKKKLLSAAGAWKNMDCDKLIREIYEGRKVSTRPSYEL